MSDLVLSLLWVLWGAICFVSGAHLIGPAVWRRALRKELAARGRSVDDRPLPDPEDMLAWLESLKDHRP